MPHPFTSIHPSLLRYFSIQHDWNCRGATQLSLKSCNSRRRALGIPLARIIAPDLVHVLQAAVGRLRHHKVREDAGQERKDGKEGESPVGGLLHKRGRDKTNNTAAVGTYISIFSNEASGKGGVTYKLLNQFEQVDSATPLARSVELKISDGIAHLEFRYISYALFGGRL